MALASEEQRTLRTVALASGPPPRPDEPPNQHVEDLLERSAAKNHFRATQCQRERVALQREREERETPVREGRPAPPRLSAKEKAQLKSHSNRGRVAEVEEFLREKTAQGVLLDVSIMNFLIIACTKAREAQKAEEYVLQMEELNIAPDDASFNSIINAWAVVGNAKRAKMWYKLMLQYGISPTEITFGTLCKALGTCGDAHGVENIMATIERSGGRLNEFHFASLISACDKVTPPDIIRAERALEELMRRDLKPDCVRRVFARVVGDERATQVFESISHGRPIPAVARARDSSGAWTSAAASGIAPPAANTSGVGVAWAHCRPHGSHNAIAHPSVVYTGPGQTAFGIGEESQLKTIDRRVYQDEVYAIPRSGRSSPQPHVHAARDAFAHSTREQFAGPPNIRELGVAPQRVLAQMGSSGIRIEVDLRPCRGRNDDFMLHTC